jgi:hypothetical protein
VVHEDYYVARQHLWPTGFHTHVRVLVRLLDTLWVLQSAFAVLGSLALHPPNAASTHAPAVLH